MSHLTGGEAVVKSLVAQGIRVVFGIPGTHGLALFDALHDAPEIRRITTRHEQGATFMADGYARATGDVGVCLTATGPGAINSLAAMGTAFTDSSPVFNIFTQIPSVDIGRGRGHLHEVPNQLGMFSEVTGWKARAEAVAGIPGLVRDAFAHMRSGNRLPAALEIPRDVLYSSDDLSILPPAKMAAPVPDERILGAAQKAIFEARRPVIWAGGGVIASEASPELVRLAECLQAPVVNTVTGKGAIPSDHPLCLDATALQRPVRQYLAGCDLMLAVGTRFDALETSEWSLQLPKTLVRIDVDAEAVGRNYEPNVAMVGDPKFVLKELIDRFKGAANHRPARTDEVSQLRSQVRDALESRSPLAVRLNDEIRAALPRDGIVASDVTICAYWCWPLFDVYHPRTYLYPWGFATLGFGLPAAIGAKVARPDKPVLAICGDGGFLYTANELATAVQFGIKVVALVVNDERYGILEPQQMAQFGRTMMTDLRNPDFAALARSFDAYGVTIDRVEEVGPALKEAFAADKPAVVELRTNLPDPYDW